MIKHVIHVCGPSASGKATLINKLREEGQSDIGLRQIFGLEDLPILPIGGGFDHIDKWIDTDKDKTVQILHKWQVFPERMIEALVAMYPPRTKHRIVVLWLLPWTLYDFVYRRKYPEERGPLTGVIKWWYETALPGIRGAGITLEHFRWFGPVEGSAPKYQRVGDMPAQPDLGNTGD